MGVSPFRSWGGQAEPRPSIPRRIVRKGGRSELGGGGGSSSEEMGHRPLPSTPLPPCCFSTETQLVGGLGWRGWDLSHRRASRLRNSLPLFSRGCFVRHQRPASAEWVGHCTYYHPLQSLFFGLSVAMAILPSSEAAGCHGSLSGGEGPSCFPPPPPSTGKVAFNPGRFLRRGWMDRDFSETVLQGAGLDGL